MRIFIIIILLLLKCNFLFSQEIRIGASYEYLYSKQWDNAIQTYNFSRPVLNEKQPLFMNGINTSVSYISKSSKNIKHGINLSYNYFRSYAANENFQNVLNLHLINPGYILHYENPGKLKGFYSELCISAVLGGLFRKLNDEPFLIDDERAKAFGIGGSINVKTGYQINIKDKIYLSPFVDIGYVPYYYSPNTEAIINQTKTLTSRNYTGILNSRAGVILHIKRE